MLCERLKKSAKWALVILAAVPVVWVLTVKLLPMEWARRRVVSALEDATGDAVRLDELSLSILGGVELRGLELARPGEESKPWLHADRLDLKLGLRNILDGCVEPSRVVASGVTLRAERRKGGTFAFTNLLMSRPRTDSTEPGVSQGDPHADRRVAFLVRDGHVTLLDEETGSRLELIAVKGDGVWQRHRTVLRHLSGSVSGGTFVIEGDLERSGPRPEFEVQAALRQVVVTRGMELLAYLAPVLSGTGGELEGRLDLDLYLRGQGGGRRELAESLVGSGSMQLDPVNVQASPLWRELAQAIHVPDDQKIGTFRSDFGIAKGRILSDDMRIEAGGLPMVMSGSTDFSGRLDYRLRSDALVRSIASSLRDLPLGLDDVLDLRIRGTPGRLSVTLEGLPLRGEHGEPLSDRQKAQELGRRLLDRMMR
jgi:AsmA protein